MATSLGMPALPPRTHAPAWRTAWDAALYGPSGFFRAQAPADHFRTSTHGSDHLAAALLTLVREAGLDTVVDLGAGRGELLSALHRLAPDLTLLGVEVAARPAALPGPVDWSRLPPSAVDGLVVAHEWLDNVPCHVVEVDSAGVPRVVHVDPATGRESLGHAATGPGVPAGLVAWLDRWWPLEGREPGARAEVGTSRDRAWSEVVATIGRGVAVAVDYGHLLQDRPVGGSLRSYAHGRQVPVVPDGTRDVTAHVAVDALADAVGGRLVRQREALARLRVVADRPELAAAASDPLGYAHRLAASTRAADLRAVGGLGDFYWVVSTVGDVDAGPLLPG